MSKHAAPWVAYSGMVASSCSFWIQTFMIRPLVVVVVVEVASSGLGSCKEKAVVASSWFLSLCGRGGWALRYWRVP